MKSKRQLIIMEIIKNHDISTQEELVDRLLENGIEVTQATISRDIKNWAWLKSLMVLVVINIPYRWSGNRQMSTTG